MNTSRCGMRTLAAIALVHVLAWLTPNPAAGEGTLTLTHTRSEQILSNGTSRITGNMRATYVGALGGDLGRNATVGTGLKDSNSSNFASDNLGSRVIPITHPGQVFVCDGPSGCAQLTLNSCLVGSTPRQYDQRTTAAILRGTGGNFYTPTPKWDRNNRTTCNPPPPPITCVCSNPQDCEDRYGPPPEGGRWDCIGNCICRPNLSPLVLHLPDYYLAGGGNQSWWRKGFCTPETPTICLDWAGNGNVACTEWTAPETDIAFVVALSHDDRIRLFEGSSVDAQPWRHFFGNVTMGPEGDFPYEHGFEALAAHCGMDPKSTTKIDFTAPSRAKPGIREKTIPIAECGQSLHVWADRSRDGIISFDELLEFQDLGIESLSDVRETGKEDKCGNTFPFESHATCSDGKCGMWLDVFFVPR